MRIFLVWTFLRSKYLRFDGGEGAYIRALFFQLALAFGDKIYAEFKMKTKLDISDFRIGTLLLSNGLLIE